MPRLKHYDNLGTARFVTFSCYHNRRLLQTREAIIPVLEFIESGRIRHGFSVLGYVIMPNHVHLVLFPHRSIRMGSVIGEIKKLSGYRIIANWKKNNSAILETVRDTGCRKQSYAFWQPRCYDHNCRTLETVREKINYCHMNPVRAGLVDDPGKWEWSSYRWYMEDKGGIVQIDEVDL